MLIRFEVENFRSIWEPVELSLVAVDDRPEVRLLPSLGLGLLPVAGLFGPNASGKSNVLAWDGMAERRGQRLPALG